MLISDSVEVIEKAIKDGYYTRQMGEHIPKKPSPLNRAYNVLLPLKEMLAEIREEIKIAPTHTEKQRTDKMYLEIQKDELSRRVKWAKEDVERIETNLYNEAKELGKI